MTIVMIIVQFNINKYL